LLVCGLVYKYNVDLCSRRSGNFTYRRKTGISGPLFVIVEFAPHGNLRQFLRERRPSEYQHSRQSYSGPSLTIRDFVSFAFQISRGMEYLGTRKVKHLNLNHTEVPDTEFLLQPLLSVHYIQLRSSSAQFRWHKNIPITISNQAFTKPSPT